MCQARWAESLVWFPAPRGASAALRRLRSPVEVGPLASRALVQALVAEHRAITEPCLSELARARESAAGEQRSSEQAEQVEQEESKLLEATADPEREAAQVREARAERKALRREPSSAIRPSQPGSPAVGPWCSTTSGTDWRPRPARRSTRPVCQPLTSSGTTTWCYAPPCNAVTEGTASVQTRGVTRVTVQSGGPYPLCFLVSAPLSQTPSVGAATIRERSSSSATFPNAVGRSRDHQGAFFVKRSLTVAALIALLDGRGSDCPRFTRGNPVLHSL